MSNQPSPDQVYIIHINEEQREAIECALALSMSSGPFPESVELLHQMIKELPLVELGDPGTHHGLCL